MGAIVLCCEFKDLPEQLSKYKLEWSLVSSVPPKANEKGRGSYQEIDYDLNHQLIDIAKTHTFAFVYLSSMGVRGQMECLFAVLAIWLKKSYKTPVSPMQSSVQDFLEVGIIRDLLRKSVLGFSSFGESVSKVGSQNLADGTKPLDAPEVADFNMRIFENTKIIQDEQSVRNIYELTDIHRILRGE